jgi:hypothetical protein
MPTMPLELQAAIRGNEVSATIGDNVLRSGMDMGPEKRRRKYSLRYDVIPLRMTVDITQLALFDEWYTNTLRAGTLAFDMIDKVSGQIRSYAFRKGAYKYRNIGISSYYITAELDSLPVEAFHQLLFGNIYTGDQYLMYTDNNTIDWVV